MKLKYLGTKNKSYLDLPVGVKSKLDVRETLELRPNGVYEFSEKDALELLKRDEKFQAQPSSHYEWITVKDGDDGKTKKVYRKVLGPPHNHPPRWEVVLEGEKEEKKSPGRPKKEVTEVAVA